MIELNKIYNEDCLQLLRRMPDNFINCCITSPPYYGLRDYGIEGQLGLEDTPEQYVEKIVEIFREIRRVIKDNGTCWLNLGDSYNESGKASSGGGTDKFSKLQQGSKGSLQVKIPTKVKGLKPKDLIGIPWMVAFALRADGWYLRQDIIWSKKNCMPESVTDRCTKSHEYVFLLAKSQKYYYNQDAIKTKMICSAHDKRVRESRKCAPTDKINGIRSNNNTLYEFANKRSVWETTLTPFNEAHFATFPEDLIVPCIKAGCPGGGIVLDPFMGAGTTAVMSLKLDRKYIGAELNANYCKIAEKRILPYKMQQKINFDE
jgi:DNA modification methylase